MISVRNHPLLSNGNNTTLFIFLFFYGLTFACTTNRKVSVVPIKNMLDLSSDSRILRDKIDTLPIFYHASEGSLPIGSDLVRKELPADEWHISRSKMASQENFKIGFVLPFSTENQLSGNINNQYNPVSRWAMHYYTGAKVALENWKNKGIKFESFVWDSGVDTIGLKKNVLSDPRFLEFPLIIGPYHRDNIKYLGNYAREAGVLLFSPFSAAQQLAEENPFFYQVNPHLDIQISAIVAHVQQFATFDQVLILQKESDSKLQDLFLQSFQSVSPTLLKDGLPSSLLLSSNTGTWSKNLYPELAKREKLVVIISSYSDEVFLNNLLQELNRETVGKKEIVVYGLSPWINADRIDYQLLESLNFHVASPHFIDVQNENVLAFQRQFFNELGILPQPEAFQAYDLVNVLMENWLENADHFQEGLETFKKDSYLSSPYQFKKIKSSLTDVEEWQYNMNSKVMILKFSDFRWQKD